MMPSLALSASLASSLSEVSVSQPVPLSATSATLSLVSAKPALTPTALTAASLTRTLASSVTLRAASTSQVLHATSVPLRV